MTNEELVAEIQAGRRELLGTLWAQVEHFIRQQALTWPHGGIVDLEDLTQAGYLALVEAVDSYTPGDMSFIGRLAFHLKTAFNEASNYRSERQRRDPMHRADSLNRPLDDEDGRELGDLIADPHRELDEAEERLWLEQLHAALEKAPAALPGAESDTLRRRYYQGQTRAKVAQETGRTAYEVYRDEYRGLTALRKPSSTLRAYIEERTPYYLHVGVDTFQQTGESAVEKIVFERERLERKEF